MLIGQIYRARVFDRFEGSKQIEREKRLELFACHDINGSFSIRVQLSISSILLFFHSSPSLPFLSLGLEIFQLRNDPRDQSDATRGTPAMLLPSRASQFPVPTTN